jgi:hypothetical protein
MLSPAGDHWPTVAPLRRHPVAGRLFRAGHRGTVSLADLVNNGLDVFTELRNLCVNGPRLETIAHPIRPFTALRESTDPPWCRDSSVVDHGTKAPPLAQALLPEKDILPGRSLRRRTAIVRGPSDVSPV